MTAGANRRRVLLIGTDGLRPDLFDPDLMPHFASLMRDGTRIQDYHAVYPTHTRVNMSSLTTGCLPGKHGVVANVFRYEGLNDDDIMNTGDYGHFQALDHLTDGRAIMVPTMGDLIDQRGKRLALATTSSTGSTMIWNRNYPYRIVNPKSTFGRADLYSLRDKLGEPPIEDRPPRVKQMEYAARAVTDIYLDDDEIEMIYVWFDEPDSALHYYGIGAPETHDAMRGCDQALAHILDGMERRGIRDQFDIIYLSDHGHSSVATGKTLAEHLDRARASIPGLPALQTASDYIYRDPMAPEPTFAQLCTLVEWLQEQSWCGVLFARDDALAEWPGVLSFREVWPSGINERAPILAVSPAWSDDPSEFGVPGMVAGMTENAALRSTHGSVSPYELHAIATFNGPSFQSGVVSEVPGGAIDIAPTVLQILGEGPKPWMDGRVLWEVFDRPDGEPGESVLETVEPGMPSRNGFKPRLKVHRVGETRYIHAGENDRAFVRH